MLPVLPFRFVLATTALLLGCGGGAAPGDASEGTDAVVVLQSSTFARPEVGRLAGCTAALVAPDAIVTAASCFAGATSDEVGDHGRFVVESGEAVTTTFVVDRVRSFTADGGDDVAVGHLATPVPGDVASPLRLAEARPLRGEPVSAWTYACGEGEGKRGVAYRYEQDLPPSGCPGAPRATADGRVFELAGARTDAMAMGRDPAAIDVVARAGAIAEQLRAWQ